MYWGGTRRWVALVQRLLTNGVTNLVNCNMQSYAGKTKVNYLPSANTANASTITPAKMKTRYFSVGWLKKKHLRLHKGVFTLLGKLMWVTLRTWGVNYVLNYLYFSSRNRFFFWHEIILTHDDFDIAVPSSTQEACYTSTLNVAQLQVVGSIPAGDSDLFLCPMFATCWSNHFSWRIRSKRERAESRLQQK